MPRPLAAGPTPSRVPILALLTVLAALAAAPASAFDWTENNDAGEHPSTAEYPIGSGSLDFIHGTIDGPFDEDMYCIRIANLQSFLASVPCASYGADDLWLFDAAGLGRAHDDACIAGQVRLSAAHVTATGNYFLAISRDGSVAQAAGSAAIWNPPHAVGERAPDGPGAAGAIVDWAPQILIYQPTSYTIQLAGCVPCDAATPARARSWGALKLIYR